MEHCDWCEIVHDERECPLCEAKEEVKELEKRVEELEGEIADMEE